MVITGLTRNQVVLTGSWVRIPPLPPSEFRINPVFMRFFHTLISFTAGTKFLPFCFVLFFYRFHFLCKSEVKQNYCKDYRYKISNRFCQVYSVCFIFYKMGDNINKRQKQDKLSHNSYKDGFLALPIAVKVN